MMPIHLTLMIRRWIMLWVGVFFLQKLTEFIGETSLWTKILFDPSELSWGQLLTVWTYSFCHTDGISLFFNLLVFAFIGSDLETVMGARRMIHYYFICTLGTACTALILNELFPQISIAPLIGPSSAIYGFLVAHGIFFSERVILFMMLFPIKAKHFIWILMIFQLLNQSTSSTNMRSLNSWINLSGAWIGFLFLWMRARFLIWSKNRQQFFKNPKNIKKNPLQLVVYQQHEDFEDSQHQPKTWN